MDPSSVYKIISAHPYGITVLALAIELSTTTKRLEPILIGLKARGWIEKRGGKLRNALVPIPLNHKDEKEETYERFRSLRAHMKTTTREYVPTTLEREFRK